MKIDLSDVKEGDEVFTLRYGNIKAGDRSKVEPTKGDFIVVDFTYYYESFDFDGRFHAEDSHPSCFHSAKECAEYFAWVAEQANKPELPDIPEGAVVAVMTEAGWQPGVFECFLDDGGVRVTEIASRIFCFCSSQWEWVDPDGKVWTNAEGE